jgi:hypothetical protein
MSASRRRRDMTRAILSLLLTLGGAACSAHDATPRIVAAPPAIETARPTGAGAPAPVRDYASALAAIVDRLERDLRLPRVEVELQLFESRRQFEQGLMKAGYSRGLARQAASTFHAIGGAQTMFVNGAELSQYPWDQQVRLIAHEAAHSVQYRLAGGVRGTSEQWLREGFADYVSCRVTAALGYRSVAWQRDTLLAPLARIEIGVRPAPLSQLRTFGQWTRAQSRYEVPLYPLAFIASELLIEDKGMEAMVRYFEASRPGTDPDESFSRAFGISLERFEATFGQQWHRVLTQRGWRPI